MSIKSFISFLFFFLSFGILITGCDNSGSGSIFGSLDGSDNRGGQRRAAGTDGSGEAFGNNEDGRATGNVSDLMYVPGGSFFPAEGFGKMVVSSFRIGKHEITRAEYYSIMGERPWAAEVYNPHHFPSLYSEEEMERFPATGMSWFEAIVFCNRLSIRENLTPVYSLPGRGTNPDNWGAIPGALLKRADAAAGAADASVGVVTDNPIYLWNRIEVNWNANGYRLPTVMEFTWAALGGSDTQYRRFSGDNGRNQIDDYAWYIVNSSESIHPVGTKRPNALGIFDMTGNVMEWCWDITAVSAEVHGGLAQHAGQGFSSAAGSGKVFVRLPEEEQTDYSGINLYGLEKPLGFTALQRAVAGGCWETNEERSALFFREGLLSGGRFPHERDTGRIGFRVVRQ
ncbi:MAG: SUMF1/EgtB/PvdO family nonheme iron enzyme [Spirochaetes bacterium]|nr:SUMF1/EgtB/PvdO family nonheme iron enzyme [Spirochaetota bacterium]